MLLLGRRFLQQTSKQLSHKCIRPSLSIVPRELSTLQASSLNQIPHLSPLSFPSIRTMSTIKRIGTDHSPNMCSAVVHNGVVTTMGVIDTTGGDITSQTKNILAHIDKLLAEAGTDKSKILTANIWLKDIESGFGKMNTVWASWVDPENKPTRATVQADLAFPSLLVEIQVTAAV